MKKIMGALLIFLVILCMQNYNMIANATTSNLSAEDLYEVTVSGNEVTVIGFKAGVVEPTEIVIPSTIAGKNVVKIEKDAFKNKALISVLLAEGIKEIGEAAFKQNFLTTVTIPSSVTTIGSGSFWGNNLGTVEFIDTLALPSQLKTISREAFKGEVESTWTTTQKNALVNLLIPSSVESIGFNAFAGNKLKTVVFKDVEKSKLKTIGARAFIGATFEAQPIDRNHRNKIEKITIPPSVETIGYHAFLYNKLTEVIFYNTPANPSRLISIGESAFNGFDWEGETGNAITKINLPESLTTIGKYAFAQTLLTNIVIPSNLNSIGENAFSMNPLTYVKFEPRTIVPLFDPLAFGSTYTSAGSWNSYPTQQPAVIPSTNNSSELVFYSGTSLNVRTIEFDDAQGNVNSMTLLRGEFLKPSQIPTYVGHEFVAWTRADNSVWDFNSDTVTLSETLKATWRIKNYKVKLDANNGDPIRTQNYNHGLSFSASPNPIKNGYRFDGWFEDVSDPSTKWDSTTKLVTSDVTLYAKWTSTVVNYPKVEKIEIDEFSNKDTQLKGQTFLNSEIFISKNGTDIAKGMSDENGHFAINIVQQAAGTKLSIRVINSYGSMKRVEIVVVDKIAPVVEIPNVYVNQTTLKGNTEANIAVALILNGQEISKGMSDKDGIFNFELSKIIAGDKLKVIATDASGNSGEKLTTVRTIDKTPPTLTFSRVSNQSKNIQVKTEANAALSLWINGKLIKSTKANSKGQYTFILKDKIKSGVRIKIVSTDKSGNKTSKTVTVIDKIAPKKPNVNQIESSDTKVTGRAEVKSTVYVFKGKNQLGKAVVRAKGTFLIAIKKQKVGTKLTIYSVDLAKNRSDNSKITVSK